MSDIAGQLLLQLILILLNAFFAATEIAVISLNEKKVKARADDGDKKAKKMLKMIEEPTRFLSTIQIGITLAGFLGSAFAADNFAERLSSFAVRAFNIPESRVGIINTGGGHNPCTFIFHPHIRRACTQAHRHEAQGKARGACVRHYFRSGSSSPRHHMAAHRLNKRSSPSVRNRPARKGRAGLRGGHCPHARCRCR